MHRFAGSSATLSSEEPEDIKRGIGFEIEENKEDLYFTGRKVSFLSSTRVSLSLGLFLSYLHE